VAAAAAISCTLAHSRTEWYSCPPVKRFGVGSPVIAGDEVDDSFLGVAGDPMRVHVALAVLRRLGREPIPREGRDELGGELDGVHELPLRVAGVHRVACEVGDGGHDLRDPGLVVGAEKRRPVARHEVVPDALGESREPARVEDLSRIAREDDRLAVPGRVDDRQDVRARHVRGRVDVRDQPHDRRLDRTGQRSEDGEALAQDRVAQPDLA
jgi:hypothetical protein